MRVKTPKMVMTFAATSDALAVEALARDHGIPGRTIPVPSQIDAGCGLAWCVETHERDTVLSIMKREGLAFEGVFEVELY